MSGHGVPGAIYGGPGINVDPTKGFRGVRISLGDTPPQSRALSGSIGTADVLLYEPPENTSQVLEVSMVARLNRAAATSAAGASAGYTRRLTVRREGSAAPVIAGAPVDVSAQEEASGSLPADWSFPAITVVGNDLVIQFAIANNSYAEGTTPNVQVAPRVTVLATTTEAS